MLGHSFPTRRSSDRGWRRQLAVTRDVLTEIGAADLPHLIVFNKMDRVGDATAQAALAQLLLSEWPEAILMSALAGDDVAFLHDRLAAAFRGDLIEDEVLIPYDRQHLRAVVFAECQVLEERYVDQGVIFRLRAAPAVLERLRVGGAPDQTGAM